MSPDPVPFAIRTVTRDAFDGEREFSDALRDVDNLRLSGAYVEPHDGLGAGGMPGGRYATFDLQAKSLTRIRKRK